MERSTRSLPSWPFNTATCWRRLSTAQGEGKAGKGLVMPRGNELGATIAAAGQTRHTSAPSTARSRTCINELGSVRQRPSELLIPLL